MSEREIHDKLDPKVWIDGAPVIRPSENGHECEVVEKWRVKTRAGIITIDKIPFYTDYASIPDTVSFIFARLLPKHGKQDFAAICHDFCYWSGCVSKKMADRIFYDLMLNLGVLKPKAWLMYKAVDWFGQSTWDDYRERDQKTLRKQLDKQHLEDMVTSARERMKR